MAPLLKPEKGVLRANGKLNNIEPINKHLNDEGNQIQCCVIISRLTDREVESAHLAQSASREAQRIQLIDLAEMVETTKLVNLQTAMWIAIMERNMIRDMAS